MRAAHTRKMISPLHGYFMALVAAGATIFSSMSLFFLCLSPRHTADSFGPCNLKTRQLPLIPALHPLLMTLNDDSDDQIEENDYDEYDPPVVANPVSRMTDYATQFLDKSSTEAMQIEDANDESEDVDSRIALAKLDDISEATHLIAVPLDSSHELLIELESVQRAILHHCPILLGACIGATTTRLPLLYIKVPDLDVGDNQRNSASATMALAGTVKRLVKKHISGKAQKEIATETDDDTESNERSSLNAQGYNPLSMTFQSLEIDGDNNNILNTVGSFCSCDYDEDEVDGREKEEKILNFNERRFENFLRDLQSAIAAQGWKMAFPPDPNRDENEQSDGALSFRPRVAFMELPKSFDENISRFKTGDTEIEEGNVKFLTAEEGGNGISPIFWCNWWEDVFARNVRLQEIGIYPANSIADSEDSSLVINSQFFVPFETVALPKGNEEMIESEQKFLEYHQKRMKEMEEKYMENNGDSQNLDTPEISDNPLSPGSSKSSEPDVLMTKTRKRLESIYLKDSGFSDIDALIEDVEAESEVENDKDEDTIDLVGQTEKTRSKEDDYMEDWMRQRIAQASTKSTKDKTEKLASMTQSKNPGNDIDDIQDPPKTDQSDDRIESNRMETRMEEKVKNAVNSLESMKNRDVEYKEPEYSFEDNPVLKAYRDGTRSESKPKPLPEKKLGPYPGNDHFVGIWKVVVNPMGDLGNSNTEESNQNLLLRVDGTTAAGPTLNPETNQKAAGGTWKMLPQENGDVLLRVRLIIPPEKKRILVMEGLVSRGTQLGVELASRTFGIPLVEERAQASQSSEVKLICSGEVSRERMTRDNIFTGKVI